MRKIAQPGLNFSIVAPKELWPVKKLVAPDNKKKKVLQMLEIVIIKALPGKEVSPLTGD